MPQERVNATTEENTAGTDTSAAVPWQRTLWAMVGIQFVMTAASFRLEVRTEHAEYGVKVN